MVGIRYNVVVVRDVGDWKPQKIHTSPTKSIGGVGKIISFSVRG